MAAEVRHGFGEALDSIDGKGCRKGLANASKGGLQASNWSHQPLDRLARLADERTEIFDAPAKFDYDAVVCHYSPILRKGIAQQALDLFRFSKQLRTSGQFTLEQADALTEALAFSLINVDDYRISHRHEVAETAQPPEHNKTTAALLAIFLGDFGAHKFYLGRTIQGFLYLILCWTFIPAIIGFFEGLIYLSYSRDEFAAEYG